MSAEIQSIVNAVRDLKPEQSQELEAALALIDGGPSTVPDREQLVHSIRGKYKHAPTFSEVFMRRKADEITSEFRP